MGLKTRHERYKSFDYLEPEKDYRVYRLAEERNELGPYQVALNPEQERRSADLAAETVMISLHDHPVVFPARMDETFAYVRDGRFFTAFEGLADKILVLDAAERGASRP